MPTNLRVQTEKRTLKVQSSRIVKVDTPRTVIIERDSQHQVRISRPVRQVKITTTRLTRQVNKRHIRVAAQQGAPGRDGVGANYTHIQTQPTSLWVIRHALGRNPGVTVMQNGVEVEASVRYIDLNRVEISFLSAQTGEAYFI